MPNANFALCSESKEIVFSVLSVIFFGLTIHGILSYFADTHSKKKKKPKRVKIKSSPKMSALLALGHNNRNAIYFRGVRFFFAR